MFLSEETKPDYRPMNNRTEIRQMPQIDHRPHGAESYIKQVTLICHHIIDNDFKTSCF
jgi:hypothetical protein